MKKENIIKKIIMKAIIGFPIGITLLIIAYASVYFISGEDVFNAELYQIHNINTLLSQIIFAGISGYILSINFYIISNLIKLENVLITEHPYKYAFTFSISSFIIIVIMLFTLKTKTFSENISILNSTIIIIVCVLLLLVFCIKSLRERHWIKEINQKIKERNNKEQ